MTRVLALVALASAACAAGPRLAAAATLKADYEFQNDLTSSVAGVPDLTSAGSSTPGFATENVNGQTRTVGTFADTGGYKAMTNGVIPADDYSVVMFVRFDAVPPTSSLIGTKATVLPTDVFRKILDFKNLASDSGLYSQNNLLAFFDANNPTSFPGALGGPLAVPDTFVQIALTRDGASDQVTAYVDGTQAFTFTDTGDLATIGDVTDPSTMLTSQFLNFFVDDNINTVVTDPITGLSVTLPTSSLEGSSGSVAYIRLYSGALTPDEVNGTAPEPASATVLLGGAAMLGLRRRRTAPRR